MRVRARSVAAPEKDELTLLIKRVEGVVREIHRGSLVRHPRSSGRQCGSPPQQGPPPVPRYNISPPPVSHPHPPPTRPPPKTPVLPDFHPRRTCSFRPATG